MRIKHHELSNFVTEVFLSKGFSQEHALLAAEGLVMADLRGILSHGVSRLDGYLRLIDQNRINVRPNIKIERENASCATIDADGAIGLVSAQIGMDISIAKTNKVGSGWVAINNSNHFGIAAYHAMRALKHNYIGFALTNASPLVSASHGVERIYGTNPICVSIPAKKENAFVLDMATSAVSNGKIEIAQRAKKSLAGEWVKTENGKYGKNPEDLKNGGSLLPLGSTHTNSSHKGYGLASWVDIFCGPLSGANYGKFVPPFVAYLSPIANLPGKGIGHFVGSWSIDGFRETEEFLTDMDLWIKHIKSTKAEEGEIIQIPGEPELKNEIDNLENGVFIEDVVYEKLKEIKKMLNIAASI